ncbi:isochorismate synthase [Microbacterium oleivorans]|uniref:isochorismate synthase n=1 Tax=Microbacterium oleivorans TaxID=273677 RepID=A0A7D5IVH9_9MICO|nr:isochorismate synthase [Microbacterium oleivorans]QLD11242.1 isochorismate synthase [Microbacterium oleivorans]
MNDSAPAVRLRAVTREVDPIEEILVYADPHDPIAWSRRGDALAARGRAVAYEPESGSGGAAAVSRWWRELVAAAEVDDPVRLPGTGLVAFGALPFDPRPDARRAQAGEQVSFFVPRLVVGRRGSRSWVTAFSIDGSDPVAELPAPVGFGPHWSATVGPGALAPEGYQSAVAAGVDAIRGGEVEKVVLARDLAGTVPAGADLRRLVRALTSAYPDTWGFAVDGLIGASPETLVTVSGGTVTARVLAGTIARGADADADTAASLALATSTKDLDEHGYAVRSVLEALRPSTSSLVAGEQPFMLKLPNVWHLATDVEGELAADASALDLVAALHPTAAVAGTPTSVALDVIRRLEPFDRGRYAGPVGWTDANGDGEWAIALRCAQFRTGEPHGVAAPVPFTAYAGAGIVAASDPESEMLETRVKFRPIVDALA